MASAFRAVIAAKERCRKPIAKLAHTISMRLALWIVRKRRRWAYFCFALWPQVLIVVLIGVALRPAPTTQAPVTYVVSRVAMLSYALLSLAYSARSRARRWGRLRKTGRPAAERT